MTDTATGEYVEVDGTRHWYRIEGEGEPIVQIHGAGFGHLNFSPATPVLSKEFRVVDFDLVGFGYSDRPMLDYSMELWAEDVAAVMDGLGIERAHIHATSMGAMVALPFAAKHADRVQSLVLNCGAAKYGAGGQLMANNLIDIVRHDPDGVGGRTLADFFAWHGLGRVFLASEEGAKAPDAIQEVLSEMCTDEIFIAAIQAMKRMDLTPYLSQITAPTLVLGGDEDIMTPWDQGPAGAGQEAVYRGIPGARKHVIAGSSHTSLFDNTDEHLRTVAEFFHSHAAVPA